MTTLSRADVLNATTFRPSKVVELPDGRSLRITGLTRGQVRHADDLAEVGQTPREQSDARSRAWVRFGAVDDDGQPLFESEAEVVAFEEKITMRGLLAIGDAILAMTVPTVDEAGGDDDPKGGSTASPASSTSTTSPTSGSDSPTSSTPSARSSSD